MKILVTGGDGLIGTSLIRQLKNSNNKIDLYQIVKPTKSKFKLNNKIFYCDLSVDHLEGKLNNLHFDYIIHLASIAHSKDSKSIFKINLEITNNLIKSIDKFSNFIFFSSISVYGECKYKYPVLTSEKCIPSTYYGKSKLCDEKRLMKIIKNLYILRLCPMISGNSKDLKKRIFLPGTSIKYKSPYKREYSFSTHESIWVVIKKILKKQINPNIINVSDGIFYNQEDILKKIEGRTFVFPRSILDFTFKILDLLSFIDYFYKIKCLFWKMFRNNTYSNENY